MIGQICAGIAVLGTIFIAGCSGQTRKLNTTEVHCENLRTPEKTKKIALISDLHFPLMNISFDKISSEIRKGGPDCIMLCGDFIQNSGGLVRAKQFLSFISEEFPNIEIVITDGNHDNVENIKNFEQLGHNIHYFGNGINRIKCGNAGDIVLLTLKDYKTNTAEAEKSIYLSAKEQIGDGNSFVILTHNPDTAARLFGTPEKSGGKAEISSKDASNENRKVTMLCGHTHGGQMYMPFNFEFRVLRKDLMPEKGYKYGLYNYNNACNLYITCGLGQSFLPLRFLTMPEIAFVYV